MGDFYGIGIEIWAGFGLVGITEGKNWADNEQLLRAVFSCFHGSIGTMRTKKLHKMMLKKINK